MKEHAFFREVLAEIESDLEAVPSDVAHRMSDPRNRFLHYVLLRKIGEGGIGRVWLAWHTSLRKYVAIKILRRDRVHLEAVGRFALEAQLASRLDHPHIVRVHHFGHHAGTPFIEMPYVDGPTLRERLGSRPMAPRPAVALLAKIARAVAYAHREGIVHRDLKPQNILLNGDDPLVTDFGLARSLDSDSGLTETGEVFGTPSYMSPEQARGARDVDVRSDIYSLGAILFHALKGRPPHEGASVLEILRNAQHRTPPVTGIDAGLDAVLRRAMAHSAADRYSSADQFADDLDRWLRGQCPIARITQRQPPTAPGPSRSSPGRFALAVVALVGLSVGVLLLLGRMKADLDRERARIDAVESRAESLSGLLPIVARVERASAAVYRADGSEETDEELDQCLALLEHVQRRQPDLAGVRTWRARALSLRPGAAVESLLYHPAALAWAEAAVSDGPSAEADRFEWDREIAQAIVKTLWTGAPMRVSRPRPDPGPSRELAWRLEGDRRLLLGETARAEENYRKAASIRQGDAVTLLAWGFSLHRLGQWAGARAAWERGRDLLRSPASGIFHAAIGLCQEREGDLAGAARSFDRAIGMRPSDGRLFLWRARVRRALGEPALDDLGSAGTLDPDLRGEIDAMLRRP